MAHEILEGTLFLIDVIGQGKEGVIRVVNGITRPFETKALVGHFLLQLKLEKRILHNVVLQAIFPHGAQDFKEVLKLPGINDGKFIKIPMDAGVDGLYPPEAFVGKVYGTPL